MLTLVPATGSVVELIERDELVYRAASGALQAFVAINGSGMITDWNLRAESAIGNVCTDPRPR